MKKGIEGLFFIDEVKKCPSASVKNPGIFVSYTNTFS